MSPRRIRWIVRAVVLGLLAAACAAALTLRDGTVEDRFLHGQTAQQQGIEMETSGAGEVYGFATDVWTRCTDDSTLPVRWFPPKSDATYRQDGGRLVVRERWRHEGRRGSVEVGWARLEGRVDGDGAAASGTIDVESRFERDGVEYARCRASGVRWRVSAG
jgi:hypothetical protein